MQKYQEDHIWKKSSSTITFPSTYIKKRRKNITRKDLTETVQTFHKKNKNKILKNKSKQKIQN